MLNKVPEIKEIKAMISSMKWLAGDNPLDQQNPWEFRSDGKFTTLRDNHGGKWDVEVKNEKATLKLKWDTTNGFADFEFTDYSETSSKFKCVNSGWGFMKSWKLFANGQSEQKDLKIKVPEIKEIIAMISLMKWIAGDNPLDQQNPWEFRSDG